MGKKEKKWSHKVEETSAALDLPKGLFKLSPKEIAHGLKKAAMESGKDDPYRSAMSMLDFYINRAGKNLSSADKNRLELVKNELRKLFGREPGEDK